ASLQTVEEVAVKIQHPSIKKTMNTDLEILHDFAKFLEDHFLWARTYRLREMMDEFAYSLRNELDYMIEGRNAEKIERQFCEDETIHIPKIFRPHTTKKVLTIEMIQDIKVNHFNKLFGNDYDRKLITYFITYIF